jgi:hypothetical protein
MKLACRATIICVYLSSLITSTFEDFTFLKVSSSLERPAPGSRNFLKPQASTRPPHLGPRMQMMIMCGVGLTPTIVKARSVLQHPPRLVPPLPRGSRVYPCHHLVQPVKICTPSPVWRLLHRKIRQGRLQPRFGTLTIQLGQKEVIILALLRTARHLRASASRCNPTRVIVEFVLFRTRSFRYNMTNRSFPLCQRLSLSPIRASSG